MHQSSTEPRSDTLSTPLQEAATPTAGTAPQVPSPFPSASSVPTLAIQLTPAPIYFQATAPRCKPKLLTGRHMLITAVPEIFAP